MIRYVHGSEDSTDLDVHYVFDNLPSFNECQIFCSSDPSENRNIIVIKKGIVTDCFKGTPDEINNGVFLTYSLHEQNCPLLVKELIPRDALIKSVRAVRCLLSHYSRTSFRSLVKSALRSPSWDEKLQALRQIDFKGVNDFKKDTRENVFKIFAFQIGQTLGLLDGVELFTKSSIASHFPLLRPYLYRKENHDAADMCLMIQQFLDRMQTLAHEEIDDFVYFSSFDKTIHLVKEEYR